MNGGRLRGTAEQQRQRLASVLVGLSAAAVVWWGWPLDGQALDALRQEVAQMQSQVPESAQNPAPPALTAPASGLKDVIAQAPALAEADAVWSWLQQRLQAQGLRVVWLKPQAVTTDKGLPVQKVGMLLQGRWHDWMAAQQALHAHVPWWVIDQWQVLPDASPSAELRIEVQGRVGLRPLPWGAEASRHVWPQWAASPGPAQAPLFGHGPAPAPLPAAAPLVASPAASHLVGPDPQVWPLEQVRLLGVWRQAGLAYAVLGAGPHQAVLRLGQSIGREAWRVHRIDDDQVDIGPATPGMGAVRRWRLTGSAP